MLKGGRITFEIKAEYKIIDNLVTYIMTSTAKQCSI
jgi:hypothetical protein